MNVRLALAEAYVPRFLLRREFRRLVRLTDEAFESPGLVPPARTFEAELEAYARGVQEQAARFAADTERKSRARARLRSRAYDFGKRLRRYLRPRTRGEVMHAARLLYRWIRIDFEGRSTGEVLYRACFFSRCFSPETCALMAALDEGVLAGLAGEGRLEFSGRITEGRDACRARFVFPEDLP